MPVYAVLEADTDILCAASYSVQQQEAHMVEPQSSIIPAVDIYSIQEENVRLYCMFKSCGML